jgi:hypothetical protein
MAKLKNCGRFIHHHDAAAFAKKFKEHHKKLLKEEFHHQEVFPHAETFSKEIILQLLEQEGAEGLRIYLGQDDQNIVRMVLVGVDEQGNDLLPDNEPADEPAGGAHAQLKLSATPAGKGRQIVEEGQRCPPYCPTTKGILNQ